MGTVVQETEYGYGKAVDLSFQAAIDKVTELLKQEGFGVLTEIDVQATLREKLGVDDFSRYTILGVCKPTLAYQALQRERQLGLLLPCNVIVYEEEGTTHVAIMNPLKALGIVKNPALNEVAESADQSLRNVLAAL